LGVDLSFRKSVRNLTDQELTDLGGTNDTIRFKKIKLVTYD